MTNPDDQIPGEGQFPGDGQFPADGQSPGDGLSDDGVLQGPGELIEELDQVLGEDVDPTLSVEAKRAIVARVRAEEGAALDRVLDLNSVAIPDGLSARVLGALDAHVGPVRGGVFAPAAPRRPRLYLVGGALAGVAAAAALFLILKKGELLDPPRTGGGTLDVAETTPLEAVPTDEFLALLPALENVDFLIDELDPLEADALFLFEAEDELLLDFLDENG